jgi:murein peptide amidase A
VRDYTEFDKRLRDICVGHAMLDVVGRVDDHAIHRVTLHPDAPGPPALVMSGTHGDEPAGVEAALQFIERASASHSPFPVVVLPCTNPQGYVSATRENDAGIDLNWVYDRRDLAEIRAIREVVRGARYRYVVDLHEDWESPGYYVYELRRNAPYIGDCVSTRVAQVCPLNPAPIIEGDRAVAGVIHPTPYTARRASRGSGVPVALYERHTDHLLTLESPTPSPLQTRVDGHLAGLAAVAALHDL